MTLHAVHIRSMKIPFLEDIAADSVISLPGFSKHLMHFRDLSLNALRSLGWVPATRHEADLSGFETAFRTVTVCRVVLRLPLPPWPPQIGDIPRCILGFVRPFRQSLRIKYRSGHDVLQHFRRRVRRARCRH